MKQIHLLLLALLFSITLTAQPNNHADSIANSEVLLNADSLLENNLDYSIETTNIQDALKYKTQMQSQRLLKNLFLIAFLFMVVITGFVFYIYHSKTKEIFKLVKIQEKEIELRQFEVAKLSIILNNTVDSAIIADEEGKMLWANNSFKNIFGCSLEKYILKNNPNIFIPENNEIKQLHEKCINSKKPIQYSTQIIDSEGNDVWFQRRIIPILDEEDKIINFAVIDTDYTALKLAMKDNN